MMREGKKHAIITGASAGLGQAFASRLMNDDWLVTSIDINEPPSPLINSPSLTHLTCDLSDVQAIKALIDQLKSNRPIDLAIFNAGINATGKFEAIDRIAIERVINVNTIAPMLLASQLKKEGMMTDQSNMLFISSLSFFTGYPGASAYAASKDAISIYAKSIRKPFAKKGVLVSCAFPGPLKTDHAKRHAPLHSDEQARMEPDLAAKIILEDCLKGRKQIYPGKNAKLFAFAGRIAPGLTTKMMRRIIFEKLDGEVW